MDELKKVTEKMVDLLPDLDKGFDIKKFEELRVLFRKYDELVKNQN